MHFLNQLGYIKARIQELSFRKLPSLQYWKKRVELFGEESVYNLGLRGKALLRFQAEERALLLKEMERQHPHQGYALDLGCGPGHKTPFFKMRTSYDWISLDPVIPFLKSNSNKESKFRINANAESIPFQRETMSLILCCRVLGGILAPESLKQCAQSIQTLLKPGGRFIMLEAVSEKGSQGHWVIRNENDYINRFPLLGLKVQGELAEKKLRFVLFSGTKPKFQYHPEVLS